MNNLSNLRILYIAKILYDRTDKDNFLTTSQISEILLREYNIKSYRTTITDDIQLLIQFGVEIQLVKSSQNKYHLANRLFDTAELKTLIDAVSSSKFISKKRSDMLCDKISSLAGNSKSKELKRNVSVEGRKKTDNEQTMIITDAINDAINKRKKIAFQYFTYNEKKKKVLRHDGYLYVLSPYKLVWNGDSYYVIGYSEKHYKIVSFRVDRIVDRPTILSLKSHPMERGFNLNSYINTMFNMVSAPRSQVDLICDNNVMDSIIDKFGEKIKITEHLTGAFKISVNVAVTNVFFSWIFGFNGRVVIDGPQDVKDKYRDMLSQGMSKY